MEELKQIASNPQYNLPLARIRELYPALPRAYLDNAAAPLFPSTVPYKAAELLCSQPIVNPHSGGELGNSTHSKIISIRRELLTLLKADPAEYDLIFCANTTAAVKLVGEALYAYGFWHCVDSHTSIVGLRPLADPTAESGVFTDAKMDLSGINLKQSVVSWPLQSNFGGKRYPGREWVEHVHAHEGLVLFDVASYVATEIPNLTAIGADFVVLSLYKMFGYPDLGALLVRRSPKVTQFFSHRKYFGGGTIDVLAPSLQFVERKQALPEMLEDGTLPIHTILTLKVAIDEFNRLYCGFNKISQHTKAVAAYCRKRLCQVQDCVLLDSDESPIVTFILKSMGHNEFAIAAAAADVHLRGGTMCNIGSFTSQRAVTELTDKNIVENFTRLGKKCNDGISYINSSPTGAIRASFGPYSSVSDVDALVDVVQSALQTAATRAIAVAKKVEQVSVTELSVYPIKSCGRWSLKTARVLPSGLEYDREFCIVELGSSNALSLKRYRSMASIQPSITADGNELLIENQNRIIRISRDINEWNYQSSECTLVRNMDPTVVEFFSQILDISCTIAKSAPNNASAPAVSATTLANRQEASLANSSPLLVVNSRSAEELELNDINVFRPNVVISSQDPWDEDHWKILDMGTAKIDLIGMCRRCNMVCVAHDGTIDNRPYQQLCKFRRINGKLYFGCHATLGGVPNGDLRLSVGDLIKAS